MRTLVLTVGIEMLDSDDPNALGELATRAIRAELEPRQGFVHVEQVADLHVADMMTVTLPDGSRRLRDLHAEDSDL